MADNGAPGVSIIERDFSQRIESASITSFATMGFFNKGPVNEPVQLQTRQDLLNIFGKPGDLSSQFWFPIASILEVNNSVWVVRVEEKTKLCAGITVGTALFDISGCSDRVIKGGAIGQPVVLQNPQRVELYPLTYGSLEADGAVDPCTPMISGNLSDNAGSTTGGGWIDSTKVVNQISVFAIGAGVDYQNVSFAIVNYDDYAILTNIATLLSESYTTAERQALASLVINLSGTASGLSPWIANSIVNLSTVDIIDSVLQSYLQFEYPPQGPTVDKPSKKKEFAFYEYENGVIIRAYMVSPEPGSKDSYGINNFANNVINNTSQNFRVFVGTSEVGASDVQIVSVPMTALAGADVLSTSLGGLEGEFLIQLSQNYASKLGIQFNALIDCGFSTVIKQRMDIIAQNRKDCIAILNVPAETMIDLTTGAKTSKPTQLIKDYVSNTLHIFSSYSGIFASYFQVYDEFNEKNRWIPCTGHIANRMAYTFNNFEQWFSFAGFERGVISGVLDVAYNPSDEQQKILYTNRINPIVNFPGEGIIIMGNKTLQNYASNSDRINVRNLIIKIGKDVSKFARTILFAQNDEMTRAIFRAQANPYLQGIMQRRGLVDYLVVCDETNNTQESIFNHEFNAWLLIKPTPTAEFVKITIANVGSTLSISDVVAKAGL